MQARKVFDVGALASLAAGTDGDVAAIPEEEPLTAQPAFWLALSGWVVAVMMFIALLVANANL